MEQHDELARALGRVPSGIFVLTARDDQHDWAMLASWVQQAGFEPPQVTVAVSADRPMGRLLAEGRPFVLNVLADEHQALLRQFAKPADDPERLFEGRELARTGAGIVVLTESLAHLECVPRSSLPAGDHVIHLAEVTAGRLRHAHRPMVHVRKSGRHY